MDTVPHNQDTDSLHEFLGHHNRYENLSHSQETRQKNDITAMEQKDDGTSPALASTSIQDRIIEKCIYQYGN